MKKLDEYEREERNKKIDEYRKPFFCQHDWSEPIGKVTEMRQQANGNYSVKAIMTPEGVRVAHVVGIVVDDETYEATWTIGINAVDQKEARCR